MKMEDETLARLARLEQCLGGESTLVYGSDGFASDEDEGGDITHGQRYKSAQQ